MLGLKIGDTFLDLDSKTSLNITLNNPIFDRDRIGRTFSYPFKLPATPLNKSLLQHQDRLDAIVTTTEYAATIYFDNLPFETGIVELKSSTENQFKIVFRNEVFTLSDELEKINIQDLEYPEQSIGYDYQPDFIFSVFFPLESGYSTVFKINDDQFLVQTGNEDEILNQINALYPASAFFLDETASTYRFTLRMQELPVPSYISLRPEVPNPDLTVYFSLDNTDDSPQIILDKWQDHLTDILNNPVTHVFPTILSPNFFSSEENPDYRQYLNYYNESGAYSNNPNVLINEQKSEFSVVPYLFVSTVFQAIVDTELVDQISSDFNNDTELSTLIVHNNIALDAHEDIVQGDPQNAFQNTWSLFYQLENHLPDLNAKEFLNKLVNTFCQFFQFNAGTLTIRSCSSVLNTSIEDWTDKSEPSYTQTYSMNEGITFDYDRQDDADTLPNQLEKYVIGNGKRDIVSEWYSLLRSRTTPFGLDAGRLFEVPFINEEGTSQLYGIENESTLRLLFYRGLQPDTNSNLYPFASHDNINTNGAEIGAFSLDWAGENGLYENFWKEYTQLITTGKTVTKSIRLTIQDLINLKSFDHPRKRIFHNKGTITAVIKSVQFKASVNGIGLAKVTFVTQ